MSTDSSMPLEVVSQAFNPRHLNLIVLPTEKCNFRCTYCYENFEVGRMKGWVVEAIKKLLVTRSGDLDSLSLSWFGGEPLLAKNIVLDISSYATELALAHRIHYAANMTTNGFFLDLATAEALLAAGVNFYQVSLDGYAEDHDSTRLAANGTGTFDRIIGNLRAIRDSDLALTVLLRCHFSPDSLPKLDRLIAFLNTEFCGDMRFRVYFKSIERLGGKNDAGITRFSESAEHEVIAHLVSRLSVPQQAYDLPEDEQYVCYAAKPNSLMIRADGSLGKCTVALYDTRNSLGHILPDGTLEIDVSKLRLWARGFASLNPDELACPYSVMNGGSISNAAQVDGGLVAAPLVFTGR
jgi:uncharacterized protein